MNKEDEIKEDNKERYTPRESKIKKIINIIKIISFIALGFSIVCTLFSNWAYGYFGDITPWQIIYTLSNPIRGTDKAVIASVITEPVLKSIISLLILLFLFVITGWLNKLFIEKYTDKCGKKNILITNSIVSLTCSSLFLAIGYKNTEYAVNQLDLMDVMESYMNASSYIEENYVDPKEIKVSFPEKKRNLIHIYMESIETSYLSKELGGYMSVNLMPELTELMKEGVSFSHNKNYGGPKVTHGSEWTIASMVNMEAGIPLKTNMTENIYGVNEFLPGVTNIGDILKEQGYNQKIVVGSDLDFAGKTNYYKQHGDYEIFDIKTAKKEGLIPEDYHVWWGYEDDKLFEYAKKELLELADKGEPFNFRMETADTHFPDGYLSEKAEKKYDSQYANVIAYSTKQAVEFVKWIQEQPFYKNTTIVITGDHLSMDTAFFENFDDKYERNVFNLIINGVAETQNYKNREFAPFDMFPTILASIGANIEGERLALGTNLFSDKETLIERDGLDVVNESLEKHSPFYSKELMKTKKD